MAIITLPAGIDWDRFPDFTPVENVQRNRSQWNNSTRVLDLDNGYFAASAAAHANTENGVRALRSFHAALRGPANQFRLPASRCQQVASNITSAGGAAWGANSASVAGANNLVLPNGIFATVVYSSGVEQLILLTAQTTLSGAGAGTIQFQPALRRALDNGATINVMNPWGLVALVPGAPKPQDVDGAMTWVIEAEEAFDA
jgi:hypothetical protein